MTTVIIHPETPILPESAFERDENTGITVQISNLSVTTTARDIGITQPTLIAVEVRNETMSFEHDGQQWRVFSSLL